MRTRIILVVSMMFLLATVFMLTLGTGFITQAQSEPNLASQIQVVKTENVAQVDTDASKVYPVDPAVAAENNRIRAERQQLANQWIASMMTTDVVTAGGQEFWVYRKVMEDRQDNDASVDLDGNIVIPADYILETWSKINEEDMVTARISIMWDTEGNLLQFSRLRDGTEYSSFLNEVTLVKEPTPFIWLSMITDDAQHVAQETDVLDGRNVTIFSFQQSIPPIPVDELDGAAVAGIHTREIYDSKTGQNIRTEVILLMADGSERPAVISDYLAFEIVPELPKRADEIFNQEFSVGAGR